MSWALEWAKGDPSDKGNPFSFEFVHLNLPSSPDYNPHLGLQVIKVNSQNCPSGDTILYVDDGCVFGADESHSLSCLCYVCSWLEHHGIQDAKQKCHPPEQ
jgi:hypothetical protein